MNQQLESDSFNLPSGLERELEAMQTLSDEELWVIAHSQMSDEQLALYDDLLHDNRIGNISDARAKQLASLGEEADLLMVRKSEALVLLHSRGHDLSSFDN